MPIPACIPAPAKKMALPGGHDSELRTTFAFQCCLLSEGPAGQVVIQTSNGLLFPVSKCVLDDGFVPPLKPVVWTRHGGGVLPNDYKSVAFVGVTYVCAYPIQWRGKGKGPAQREINIPSRGANHSELCFSKTIGPLETD